MADIYFKMVHHKEPDYFRVVKFDKNSQNLESMRMKYQEVDKNGSPVVAKAAPVKAAPKKPAKKKAAKK